jgi:hypothetical protein
MPNEWKFTLETTTGGGATQKDYLKEPLGFKQDTHEVNVRAGNKNGLSHQELIEAVSRIVMPPPCPYPAPCRKRTNSPSRL